MLLFVKETFDLLLVFPPQIRGSEHTDREAAKRYEQKDIAGPHGSLLCAFTLPRPQHAVQRVESLVIRQIGEGGLDPQAVPDHAAIDALGARHAAIRNHLVELGSADADIARSLVAGHAAWRIGYGVGAAH